MHEKNGLDQCFKPRSQWGSPWAPQKGATDNMGWMDGANHSEGGALTSRDGNVSVRSGLHPLFHPKSLRMVPCFIRWEPMAKRAASRGAIMRPSVVQPPHTRMALLAVAKSVACGLIMANWRRGVAAIITANTANTATTAALNTAAATRCCYCEPSIPAELAPEGPPEWFAATRGSSAQRLERANPGLSAPKASPDYARVAHPRTRPERAGVRAQAPTLRHRDPLLQE
jgi:hypothetical protein